MAPAGDLEKLKYAIWFGADSVYLGAKSYGLRAKAGNFSEHEIREGVDFAHERGAKVYVTLNILARNDEVGDMVQLSHNLYQAGVDGFIVSDPGFIGILRNELPQMHLTLSTQASTTNRYALEFWKNNGINRVVLARELSFREILEISKARPEGMELEVFVHGAMCISYSGRCLISSYLTGRDSNRGNCAQPCRWSYTLKESTRPGEYFDVEEDNGETFFFNSKDLCLVEHIPQLIDAGIDAFKVEGRMKSIYYVSTVVNAYKSAVNRSLEAEGAYEWRDLYEELTKVSHRSYTKAFFLPESDPSQMQNYETSSYVRTYDFIGEVTFSEGDDDLLSCVIVRNRFKPNEAYEVVRPGALSIPVTILRILKPDTGEELPEAIHPKEAVMVQTDQPLYPHDLIRRKASSAF
jgi:putative protease